MTASHSAINVPQAHDMTTSTPQNTPANAAPISSRAQQPGVASIKEGEFSPRQKFRALPPHHPLPHPAHLRALATPPLTTLFCT